MRFHGRHLASDGANSHTLATRCGTVRTTTLAVVFQAAGYQIYQHDGFLELTGKVGLPPPNILLQALAQGKGPDPSLGDAAIPLEKYHPWLTAELRHADALSSRFDLAALPQICKAILE
jgi:ATP-dependent helicase Lhr and Lhr-like helicase